MSNSPKGQNKTAGLRRRCFRGALLLFLICGLSITARAQTNTVNNCSFQTLNDFVQIGGLVKFAFSCTPLPFTGTILVGTNTTIDAAGQTISLSGQNQYQLFRVASNASLTILNASLVSGNNTNGGALFIESGATVVLSNCTFTFNNASGTAGTSGADGADHPGTGGDGGNGTAGKNGFGGAIYNNGTLTALLCQFAMNNASGGAGGDGGSGGSGETQGGDGGNGGLGGAGFGGAIYNNGVVSLTNCTFEGNAALGGLGGAGGEAGLGAFAGLVGNGKAGGEGSGGGIFSTGRLSVTACTFSANRAQSGDCAAAGNSSSGNANNGPDGEDSLGGAICNTGQSAFTNSTFFANTAHGGIGGDGGSSETQGGDGGNGGDGRGGGIHNSGTNYLLNCTLAQGGATGGTNGIGGFGPLSFGDEGTKGAARGGNISNTRSFALKNSIIANATSGGNGNGTFTGQGNNLSSDTSISLAMLGGGSFFNTSALISTLASNGGPTKTMTLQEGSPAFNTADSNNFPVVDQRGVPRPFGDGPDIGAVESAPVFRIQGIVISALFTNFVATNNNVVTTNRYIVTNALGVVQFAGLAGIEVNVTNETFSTTSITDTNGRYSAENLVAGDYFVAPQPVGLFTRTNAAGVISNVAAVVISNADVANVNFFVLNESVGSITFTPTNSAVTLFITAFPSHTEIIEASTNLVNWDVISTNTAMTNGLIQFPINNTSNFPIRFFRTRLK